jgi:hypothetical protein
VTGPSAPGSQNWWSHTRPERLGLNLSETQRAHRFYLTFLYSPVAYWRVFSPCKSWNVASSCPSVSVPERTTVR